MLDLISRWQIFSIASIVLQTGLVSSEVREVTTDTFNSLLEEPLVFIKLDNEHVSIAPLNEAWEQMSPFIPLCNIDCTENDTTCHRIFQEGGTVQFLPAFAAWIEQKFILYTGSRALTDLQDWIKTLLEADSETIMAMYEKNMESRAKELEGKLDNVGFIEKAEKSILSGEINIESREAATFSMLIAAHALNNGDNLKAAKFAAYAAQDNAEDDCGKILHATMLHPYLESRKEADTYIERWHERMDKLLHPSKKIDLHWSKMLSNDYQNMCVFSGFEHSLYYEPDAASRMSKYIQLIWKSFSYTNYTAPHLRGKQPKCREGKIKLGLASAFWKKGSSVYSDFIGVLSHLSLDKFEIHIIDFKEESQKLPGEIPMQYGISGDVHLFQKGSDTNWFSDAQKEIGNLELDILLYLDLTMSGSLTMLAMSRLARVQATSHGHPMTSGIDKSVMDFYISWAAAELDEEEASKHYTERLALLPAHTMHQYYEPRTDPQTGLSTITQLPYSDLTRADFTEFEAADDGTWYLCMQKPFKRQHDFDDMLVGITEADPNAHLLLHSDPMHDHIFLARLKAIGGDDARIHFVPQQPHHRLMALYSLADVILDSYPAGGCTTTREALEVGGLVVTLPARYLGSRWTLAYYTIIGVTDLVATSKKEYVEYAVKLGTDPIYRKQMRSKMQQNMPKLWYRTEAIDAWTDILMRISHFEWDNYEEPKGPKIKHQEL